MEKANEKWPLKNDGCFFLVSFKISRSKYWSTPICTNNTYKRPIYCIFAGEQTTLVTLYIYCIIIFHTKQADNFLQQNHFEKSGFFFFWKKYIPMSVKCQNIFLLRLFTIIGLH